MKLHTIAAYIDILFPVLVQYCFRIINSHVQHVCKDTYPYEKFTQLFLSGEIACQLNSCIILLSHVIPQKYSLDDSSFRVMVNAFIINVFGAVFCAIEMSDHNVCKDRFG